jgi:hypothetical protein
MDLNTVLKNDLLAPSVIILGIGIFLFIVSVIRDEQINKVFRWYSSSFPYRVAYIGNDFLADDGYRIISTQNTMLTITTTEQETVEYVQKSAPTKQDIVHSIELFVLLLFYTRTSFIIGVIQAIVVSLIFCIMSFFYGIFIVGSKIYINRYISTIHATIAKRKEDFKSDFTAIKNTVLHGNNPV